MKKSIPILLALLLVLTLFTSCNELNYQHKRLILENKSDYEITRVTLTFSDGVGLYRGAGAPPTPIILPGASKEYSLPYLNNGGRSSAWTIEVDAYNVETSGYEDAHQAFTFNTTLTDKIIITFDEGESDYTLEGEGSGYQEIPIVT